MRTFIGKNPLAMMTELVEHNLSLWKSVNERLQQYAPPGPPGDSLPAPHQSPISAETATPSTAKPEKTGKERKNKKEQG